ncbi:MAG: MFS transporter [Chloroflexi bacterium]|nr:MFS transporter [Chloroflexota bacterium]
MQRLRRVASSAIWSGPLLWLALATFFVNFGQGLFRGASTNFFIDTLGLDGGQVLWLAGLREVPGLALMFIAALIMHLPLTHRTAMSALLMGIGYGLYALVGSFAGLVAVAFIASLGFHNWMPLQNSLAMSLAPKERSGRVMGAIASVRALAGIVGVGAVALISKLFIDMSLRLYYVIGGLLVALAALFVLRIPSTVGTKVAEPRMLLDRRYWLYYVLTFFEGSRTQVFASFGTLVLVEYYGLTVWQISLLLLVSGIVNFALAPALGYALDRYGERWTLSVSYVLLALSFIGFATFHNAWLLSALLISINLLVTLSVGLSTYVNRIAPEEELTPTLSAGVSINHITSVAMSLLAGTLLRLVGYEALSWGAAAIILVSVPFALALRIPKPLEMHARMVTAK